jgi:2,4-dienoyl-CoA reductase (NADPH2)
MGSMHTGLEDRFYNYGKLAAFYRERARGGVGLIVTGGISPNRQGWLLPFGGTLNFKGDVFNHRRVTRAVHEEGGKILLQILHAGRYGYQPLVVSASEKSPISPFKPRALTERGIEATIAPTCAAPGWRSGRLRRRRGDGQRRLSAEPVPVRAHQPRTDRWGGSIENRMRLPVEIVRRIRARRRPRLHHHVPPLGARPGRGRQYLGRGGGGGQALEQAGVDHPEHRLRLARGARADHRHLGAARRAFAEPGGTPAQGEVTIPVVASNRINMPADAENLLARGDADLVSMARPFLADPTGSSRRRRAQRRDQHLHRLQPGLPRPHLLQQARHLPGQSARLPRDGTGVPPGAKEAPRRRGRRRAGRLSAATVAAERGHEVTLFDASDSVGGQFKIAMQHPRQGRIRGDHPLLRAQAGTDRRDAALGRA